jgi:hypothetical protein
LLINKKLFIKVRHCIIFHHHAIQPWPLFGNLFIITLQRGGAPIALLEITGGKGAVQVNGKLYQKNETLALNGGDEVIFTTSGKHAYVSFSFTLPLAKLCGFMYYYFCCLYYSSVSVKHRRKIPI